MSFHRNVEGTNVVLDASSTIGRRFEEEFSRGFVFTSNVVNVGERIVVQV
jgi:hypothetical protein